MRFEIIERDGLARTGKLETDGAEYVTPTIAFLDTARYQAPKSGLKLKQVKDGHEGDLLVAPSGFSDEPDMEAKAHLWPGFRGSPYADHQKSGEIQTPEHTSSLLLDSSEFTKFVELAKTGENLLSPAFCPVMGLPHRLAFLVYCGFDLFDSIPLIMAGENGGYLTGTGVLSYDKLKDLPCSCPACASGERSKSRLLAHNYITGELELRLVRHAISEGRLRELVEERIRTDPWLVQGLRLLDLHHQSLQELHAPVRGTPFHAGSKESLLRPDVVRWMDRLKARYRRPESARILVLLPCSARKPYSMSQSHRKFKQAIESSGKADLVHEVIVTSPLGIVPRELELFYPAQDYDIPVTGHWDRDEKRLAEESVSWLVASQGYDIVVSHLGDEREPVNSMLKDFVDTSHGHPGSRESLERLEAALREAGMKESGRGTMPREVEDMASLCRFQFGPPGEHLCEDAHLEGRWPNLKIMKQKSQMGMVTGQRGMVSLTIEGARVIASSGAYCVQIDDFKPKGNLFAIGVDSASPEIRIGDDVAVIHSTDVRAVGVAVMAPTEMTLAERGEAVHIRHLA